METNSSQLSLTEMYGQVCYKKEDVYLPCHFSCQYIQTYDLHGVSLDRMCGLSDLV